MEEAKFMVDDLEQTLKSFVVLHLESKMRRSDEKICFSAGWNYKKHC